MSRQANTVHDDYIVEHYLAGESMVEIGKVIDRTPGTIRSRLLAKGIRTRSVSEGRRLAHERNGTPERVDLDAGALIERYLAGESEKALSIALGVNRETIRLRLIRAGIPIRGRSEAMSLRMAVEDRLALTRAAHLSMGIGEDVLVDALRLRGVDVERQVAVGSFSIDLSIPSLLIEVHNQNTGPLGPGRADLRERLEYLLDHWGSVLYVWTTLSCPMTAAVANEAISAAYVAQGDPATRGQYWVVRGCGQLVASGGGDMNGVTIMPTSSHRHHRSSDRRL